jgi:imidazolonepropionase-like amidohydrolase
MRTYGTQALAEAAMRVHAAGGRIAIHCGIPDVIQDAIDAGFDSIEHGSFMQPDQAGMVAERGIAWVPTRSIEAAIRGMVRDLGGSADVVRRFDEALARQPEVLQQAVQTGAACWPARTRVWGRTG